MEKQCKINIRYMYLMDYEQPSYRAFSYSINEEIEGQIEDIFKAVMDYIIRKDHVDLQHLYIDGRNSKPMPINTLGSGRKPRRNPGIGYLRKSAKN